MGNWQKMNENNTMKPKVESKWNATGSKFKMEALQRK